MLAAIGNALVETLARLARSVMVLLILPPVDSAEGRPCSDSITPMPLQTRSRRVDAQACRFGARAEN